MAKKTTAKQIMIKKKNLKKQKKCNKIEKGYM